MLTYYTPEIEEFHVGFEYEQYENYDVPGKEMEWHKWIYGTHGNDNPENITYPLGYMANIRVKHLDREDIESLDWKFYPNNSKVPCFEKGKFSLTLHKDGNVYIFNREEGDNLFSGKIKNKSELKRILKQIGV